MTKHINFIAAPTLDRSAKMDRESVFKMASNPFRGYQLGLAMFEASAKAQHHPLAMQIGRTARAIADK